MASRTRTTRLRLGSTYKNLTIFGTRARPSMACASPAAVKRMSAVFESSGIICNMARTPDITVAAVTESDGRFLVVEERINRRLVFNQPAGHVEQGESLVEAVVREVREETAWGFLPQALLGVYLWRNPASGRSYL